MVTENDEFIFYCCVGTSLIHKDKQTSQNKIDCAFDFVSFRSTSFTNTFHINFFDFDVSFTTFEMSFSLFIIVALRAPFNIKIMKEG